MMPDNRDDNSENKNKADGASGGGPSKGKANGGGGGGGAGGDGNMRFSRSMLGWILILSIAVLIFVVFHGQQGQPTEKSWSEFRQEIEKENIARVTSKNEGGMFVLTGTYKEGKASGKGVDANGKPEKILARIHSTSMD